MMIMMMMCLRVDGVVLGQERKVACNTKKLHATTCYCNATVRHVVIAIVAPHSTPA